MRNKYLMALCLLIATGCASARTAKEFKYLTQGMTESEVTDLLGKPEKVISQGEQKTYHFRLCDRADLAWCGDRYADDYWTVFKDGKLIQAMRTSTDGQTREPLFNAEAAKAFNQSIQNANQNQPQVQRTPTSTNCTSYKMGNTVQTNCQAH